MKKFIFFILLLFLFPIFIFGQEKVDINSASLQQLDKLMGVGPALAQRITNTRPYSSVDDLLKVKGIGPTTLQKIKEQNLACVFCQSTQEDKAPTIQTPAIKYSDTVIFNELLPNPSGSDETEEWVELKNTSTSDVDLSGWQIKDITGTVSTFTIPNNTKILGSGFLVFKRPETKIMLNNDGDGLILYSPKGDEIDNINFTNAPLS